MQRCGCIRQKEKFLRLRNQRSWAKNLTVDDSAKRGLGTMDDSFNFREFRKVPGLLDFTFTKGWAFFSKYGMLTCEQSFSEFSKMTTLYLN